MRGLNGTGGSRCPSPQPAAPAATVGVDQWVSTPDAGWRRGAAAAEIPAAGPPFLLGPLQPFDAAWRRDALAFAASAATSDLAGFDRFCKEAGAGLVGWLELVALDGDPGQARAATDILAAMVGRPHPVRIDAADTLLKLVRDPARISAPVVCALFLHLGERISQHGDVKSALCPIALTALENAQSVVPCGHVFSEATVEEWQDGGGDGCPLCRAPIEELRPEPGVQSIVDELFGQDQRPALLEALLPADQPLQSQLRVFTGLGRALDQDPDLRTLLASPLERISDRVRGAAPSPSPLRVFDGDITSAFDGGLGEALAAWSSASSILGHGVRAALDDLVRRPSPARLLLVEALEDLGPCPLLTPEQMGVLLGACLDCPPLYLRAANLAWFDERRIDRETAGIAHQNAQDLSFAAPTRRAALSIAALYPGPNADAAVEALNNREEAEAFGRPELRLLLLGASREPQAQLTLLTSIPWTRVVTLSVERGNHQSDACIALLRTALRCGNDAVGEALVAGVGAILLRATEPDGLGPEGFELLADLFRWAHACGDRQRDLLLRHCAPEPLALIRVGQRCSSDITAAPLMLEMAACSPEFRDVSDALVEEWLPAISGGPPHAQMFALGIFLQSVQHQGPSDVLRHVLLQPGVYDRLVEHAIRLDDDHGYALMENLVAIAGQTTGRHHRAMHAALQASWPLMPEVRNGHLRRAIGVLRQICRPANRGGARVDCRIT